MRLATVAACIAAIGAQTEVLTTQYIDDSTAKNLTLDTESFAKCVGSKSENLYVGVNHAGYIYVQAYEQQDQLLPHELFGCVNAREHASDIHLVTGARRESSNQARLARTRDTLSGISSNINHDEQRLRASIQSPGYTVAQVLMCPDSDACSGRTVDSGGQSGVCYNESSASFKSAGLWTYICSGYLEWTTWSTGICGGGNNHTTLVPAGNSYCMRESFSSYYLGNHGHTC